MTQSNNSFKIENLEFILKDYIGPKQAYSLHDVRERYEQGKANDFDLMLTVCLIVVKEIYKNRTETITDDDGKKTKKNHRELYEVNLEDFLSNDFDPEDFAKLAEKCFDVAKAKRPKKKY